MRRGSLLFFLFVIAVLVLSSCGRGRETATRTPVPTWTPTQAVASANPNAQAPAAQPAQPAAQTPQPSDAANAAPAPAPAAATDTPTVAPPTETPTSAPTSTPTTVPTDTPAPPTATPTDTPTPVPTPTPSYDFALEAADKLPTDALASNVVRIWLYVYSPSELGLGDYSLRVTHNGAPLAVGEVSTAGVPGQTRTDPGPFTRFTNMNLLFVEPQAGTWEIQLVDSSGAPAGPPAQFELTADEVTRELYVRYKQVAQ